jgi:uncharacterized membrane protein
MIKKYRTYVAAFSVAIIVILGFFVAPAIHRQLNDWKLLPEPERLTELYFTDPNNLPSSYSVGQQQTVRFTVHNLEYRTTTYNYVVSDAASDGSQTSNVTTGSFTLAQNASKQVVINIVLPDVGTHGTVSVKLPEQNEAIDYLVQKEGV